MQVIKTIGAALLMAVTAATAHGQAGDSPKTGYGKNILSLAVLQMNNESAAGLGVHYERVLDPKGIISFYLPVAVSFVQNNDNYYYGPGSAGPIRRDPTTFFSAYPGLKIYPTGSHGIVRYSVGPSLAVASGNKWVNQSYYDQNTGQTVNVFSKESIFQAGVIVNNGLNVQPMKNLYLGLEVGLGFYYYNQENDYNDYWNGEPMIQFNFKMGYRF